MTKQERKRIMRALQDRNQSGANPLWQKVFDNLLITYAFTDKEKLLRKLFVDGNNKIRICMDLYISERLYYYWIQEICETATKWAAEYGLI